ncbi:hypothetical protein G6F42_022880 [Rhizopus arrhizus]|nr:hypothetical protein G6F42_022880 [Rhizopus arrhizus]
MKNCKTNNLNLNFWATAAVALTKAHFDEAAVNVNFENAAKGDCRSRLESTEYKAKHKNGESSKQLPTNKKQVWT